MNSALVNTRLRDAMKAVEENSATGRSEDLRIPRVFKPVAGRQGRQGGDKNRCSQLCHEAQQVLLTTLRFSLAQ